MYCSIPLGAQRYCPFPFHLNYEWKLIKLLFDFFEGIIIKIDLILYQDCDIAQH